MAAVAMAHTPKILTSEQMARFEAEGFVTIDTPLSAAQLDAAEGAFDPGLLT
jgi:hypothetical protein